MKSKLYKYLQLILMIIFLVMAAWQHNDYAMVLSIFSILFTVQFNV